MGLYVPFKKRLKITVVVDLGLLFTKNLFMIDRIMILTVLTMI
jgi:hypothetical protein